MKIIIVLLMLSLLAISVNTRKKKQSKKVKKSAYGEIYRNGNVAIFYYANEDKIVKTDGSKTENYGPGNSYSSSWSSSYQDKGIAVNGNNGYSGSTGYYGSSGSSGYYSSSGSSGYIGSSGSSSYSGSWKKRKTRT